MVREEILKYRLRDRIMGYPPGLVVGLAIYMAFHHGTSARLRLNVSPFVIIEGM